MLLVAAMAAAHWNAGAAPAPRMPQRQGIAVDVELVIAVDISYSMDPDEQALQREGYVRALTSQADCLFDWGERHYPTYLQPAPQSSQTLGDYYYRAYPGSRTYLGISLTGSRLLFLDDRGGGIQDLGALDGWLATAGCN